MRPYSIWVSLASLVVQEITAELAVTLLAVMLEMAGGVVSGEREMGREQEAVVPPLLPTQFQR